MARTEPSEFALFVRDTAKRAIENVIARIKNLEAPQRAVIRSWSKLSEAEKDSLVDEVIAASTAPAPEAGPEPEKTKKKVKRFEPEEVEKTLPKKIKKKTAAKKRK